MAVTSDPDIPLPSTRFASAQRSSSQELYNDYHQLKQSASLYQLLDGIPTVIMVLNHHRQVVFCNRALVEFLGKASCEEILGQRPGELLNCIHSAQGCGTTEFCQTCGAVNAILTSQNGQTSVQECRITTSYHESIRALDLRVWANPMTWNGQPFTIFTLADIADEKRRAVLERLFYHDIYNTLGGFKGALELLRPHISIDDKDVLHSMDNLVTRLNDELESHRILTSAENNDLSVSVGPIQSVPLLESLAESYSTHPVAQQRHIQISANAVDVQFFSDPILLQRVLGNMLKNALEAIQPDETVTLGCLASEERIQFWMHNPGVVPRDVQLQLFQRSFSTKDSRRGLGTYRMKLLSESYLQGNISFSSSQHKGTMFVGTYPLRLRAR